VIMKAEQIRHMLHVETRMAQIEVGQLPAHIVQDILELRAILLKASLKRSLADVQCRRNRFHITLPLALPLAQALDNQRTNPANNRAAGQLVQLSLGKTVMEYGERLVGHTQRTQKLLAIEQDAVISRPETQRAAKKPLMLRRIFRLGISELYTQRLRRLATRQPAAETQQRSQACIRILPGFDRATLLMIEAGQTEMLLLLDKKKAESGTDQRAETNQAFERPF